MEIYLAKGEKRMFVKLLFEDIVRLHPGEIIYEEVCGQYKRIKVTSLPVRDFNISMGQRRYTQVRFEGKNLDKKWTPTFLVTEGLEHYGPKLYREESDEIRPA